MTALMMEPAVRQALIERIVRWLREQQDVKAGLPPATLWKRRGGLAR